MGKGSAYFTIGVAILVGIVAIVGASVFASGMVTKSRDYADAQLTAAQAKTAGDLKSKADKSLGQFDKLSAEEVSATVATIADSASIEGSLDVEGDSTILGNLLVWGGSEDEPVLEVVSGGVNLAQLTSAGNIQNSDGTFVVDSSGALNARTGVFSGALEAAGAQFGSRGLAVNAGGYSFNFDGTGFSISNGAARIGFGPSGGTSSRLPKGTPYLFSSIVAADSFVALTEDGAIQFDQAYSDSVFSVGWIGDSAASAATRGAAVRNPAKWVLTAGDAIDGLGKAVVVNGKLVVKGALAEIKSGLKVTGNLEADTADVGTMTVGTINNNNTKIVIDEDVEITGSLVVLRDFTAASVSAGSLVSTGTLDVKGTATFTGGFVVDNSADETSTIVDALDVGGNLKVGGNLIAPSIQLTGVDSELTLKTATLTRALELDSATIEVLAGDFVVDTDNNNGTPDFVIDRSTGLTFLPGAVSLRGAIAVASGDFAVDVDDDGTNDFTIDRTTMDATLPGKLTLASGNADIAGYVIADAGIDNGSGTWAGTATIGTPQNSETVDPGVSFESVVITPLLANGMSPVADYGVASWWVVDNGDDTFDIVTDSNVSADMTFSYMVIR